MGAAYLLRNHIHQQISGNVYYLLRHIVKSRACNINYMPGFLESFKNLFYFNVVLGHDFLSGGAKNKIYISLYIPGGVTLG